MKSDTYEDIINLEHHVSKKHPQMDIIDRAAQFAPFSALTGYDEAVKEAARRTQDKVDISESLIENLNMKIQILLCMKDEYPEVTVIYFRPDEKKSGGMYLSECGKIIKIDLYNRIIIMENKTEIPIEMIVEIDSEIFDIYNI